MKVAQEAIAKYGTKASDSGIFDMDAHVLLDQLDIPEGGRVLCVGTHDEAVANALQESDFVVTGVDLREYDPHLPPCNYEYIRRDFCEVDRSDFPNQFDAFVSLSAIEHFGYGTYQEGQLHKFYDVIAMRKAWELLKEGGMAYITVPFGKNFVEYVPHWRIYNEAAVFERLVQDFTVVGSGFFCSGQAMINGVMRPNGTVLTADEAKNYDNSTPHVTVFLILRKTPVKRLAPDGR